MSVSYQDYYETLGVKRDATAQEISKAYRALARKFHPDVSKEKGAEDKFKSISEAYEVLKDPEKRKLYDQLGANWKAGQDFKPPPGWEDIFSQFGGFGGAAGGSATSGQSSYGRQSGRSRTTGSMGGATFSFGGGNGGFSDFFDMLFGAGAQEGFGDKRSGKTGGRNGGKRGRTSGFNFSDDTDSGDRRASLAISPLESIHGGSKVIQLPSSSGGEGKKLRVKVPANTPNGAVIRLSGQGESRSGGKGQRGDLLLEIEIRPGDNYDISGNDLLTKLKVPAWTAALGEKLEINTPDGLVAVKIPAGAESGQQLRLRGRGLPIKGNKTRGDLLLEISIFVPKNLSAEQRELWEKLSKERT